MIRKFKTAFRIFKTGGSSAGLLYFRLKLLQGIVGLALPPFRMKANKDPARLEMQAFFDRLNAMPSPPRILELGSRNISHKHLCRSYSEYIGFDINPGPCVDVVGDAHRLSDHFPENHFDAVYAISVFEHLAMPWKAVQEIRKVLKPGGLLFLFTHPDYPPHAEPWDFWRFPKSSFGVLFNEATGFGLLSCVEGCPAIMVSLEDAPMLRAAHRSVVFMGISVLAQKSGEPSPGLAWNIPTSKVAPASYPGAEVEIPSRFLGYLATRARALQGAGRRAP